MVMASTADLALVTNLAAAGALMTALPLTMIALLFVATVAFAFSLDAIKVAVFRRRQID